MDKERKNFSIRIIEEVFEEQGRCCFKCGLSLVGGFNVHHKDSDSSNDNKDNCVLLCARCHDSEKWNTLQIQQKEVLGELRQLVKKAVEGTIAGAVIDKTLDGINKVLNLQKQLYSDPLLEAPAISRIEYSEAIAEYNLKEYVRGVKEGVTIGLEISKEVKK